MSAPHGQLLRLVFPTASRQKAIKVVIVDWAYGLDRSLKSYVYIIVSRNTVPTRGASKKDTGRKL